MGNLLCLPKSQKRSGRRQSKKGSCFKWWIWGKGDDRNQDTNDGDPDVTYTTDIGEQVTKQPEEGNKIQSESQVISVHQPVCHITPTVSSSILLRPLDEEFDSDTETELAKKFEDGVEKGSTTITLADANKSTDELSKEQNLDTTSVAEQPTTTALVADVLLNREELKKEVKDVREPSITEEDAKNKEFPSKIIEVKPAQEIYLGQGVIVKSEINEVVETGDKKKLFKNGPSTHDLGSNKSKPQIAEPKILKFEATEGVSFTESNSLKQTSSTGIQVHNLENKDILTAQTPVKLDSRLENDKPLNVHVLKGQSVQGVRMKKEPDRNQHLSTADVSSIKREVVSTGTTTDKQKDNIHLKATQSSPVLKTKSKVSEHMKDFNKILEALSALKVPERSATPKFVKPASFSRNVFSPQPGTSDSTNGVGYYSSSSGIEKWLRKSVSGSVDTVEKEDIDETASATRKTNLLKKVSDFAIPQQASRPPPKPLILKKPSPHLFSLPSIAKSEMVENSDRRWTQTEPKGPLTDLLWTTKPTAFDVKFPPLPKRLLEREGSIDKLRDSWVLPQVKQIETLKREYGRYPGLRISKQIRDNYSVDIESPCTSQAHETNVDDDVDEKDDIYIDDDDNDIAKDKQSENNDDNDLTENDNEKIGAIEIGKNFRKC